MPTNTTSARGCGIALDDTGVGSRHITRYCSGSTLCHDCQPAAPAEGEARTRSAHDIVREQQATIDQLRADLAAAKRELAPATPHAEGDKYIGKCRGCGNLTADLIRETVTGYEPVPDPMSVAMGLPGPMHFQCEIDRLRGLIAEDCISQHAIKLESTIAQLHEDLAAETQEWESLVDYSEAVKADLREKLNTERARANRAEKALRDYGKHWSMCQQRRHWAYMCSCGLEAALTPKPEEAEHDG